MIGRADHASPDREMDLLRLSESVAHLGRGPDVLVTPDVPRYPELSWDLPEKPG